MTEPAPTSPARDFGRWLIAGAALLGVLLGILLGHSFGGRLFGAILWAIGLGGIAFVIALVIRVTRWLRENLGLVQGALLGGAVGWLLVSVHFALHHQKPGPFLFIAAHVVLGAVLGIAVAIGARWMRKSRATRPPAA